MLELYCLCWQWQVFEQPDVRWGIHPGHPPRHSHTKWALRWSRLQRWSIASVLWDAATSRGSPRNQTWVLHKWSQLLVFLPQLWRMQCVRHCVRKFHAFGAMNLRTALVTCHWTRGKWRHVELPVKIEKRPHRFERRKQAETVESWDLEKSARAVCTECVFFSRNIR